VVARVELLGETFEPSPGSVRTVDADDWAALFLEKASAIIEHRCPGDAGA
jgi:hypothetical protein